MAPPKFRLEVSYQETTGDPVAAYLRIREGNVSHTKEISAGVAFADYDADGSLLGIELLAPAAPRFLPASPIQSRNRSDSSFVVAFAKK